MNRNNTIPFGSNLLEGAKEYMEGKNDSKASNFDRSSGTGPKISDVRVAIQQTVENSGFDERPVSGAGIQIPLGSQVLKKAKRKTPEQSGFFIEVDSDAVEFFQDVLMGKIFPPQTGRNFSAYFSSYIDEYRSKRRSELTLKGVDISEIDSDLDMMERFAYSIVGVQSYYNEFMALYGEFRKRGRFDRSFLNLINDFPKYYFEKQIVGNGIFVLKKMHNDMDALFSGSGEINQKGRVLIDQNILPALKTFYNSVQRRHGELTDDELDKIDKTILLFTSISSNSWRYSHDDVVFLTSMYDFFADLGVKNLAIWIEQIVRYRRVPFVDNKRIDDGVQEILNTIRSILRSAYGAGGRIKNVDLKHLLELKKSLKTLDDFEDPISPLYDILRTLFSDLGALFRVDNVLGLSFDKSIVRELRMVLKGKKEKEAFDEGLKDGQIRTFFDISRAPTFVFSESTVSEEQYLKLQQMGRSKKIVSENVQRDHYVEFWQNCLDNSEFARKYSSVLGALNHLESCYKKSDYKIFVDRFREQGFYKIDMNNIEQYADRLAVYSVFRAEKPASLSSENVKRMKSLLKNEAEVLREKFEKIVLLFDLLSQINADNYVDYVDDVFANYLSSFMNKGILFEWKARMDILFIFKNIYEVAPFYRSDSVVSMYIVSIANAFLEQLSLLDDTCDLGCTFEEAEFVLNFAYSLVNMADLNNRDANSSSSGFPKYSYEGELFRLFRR